MTPVNLIADKLCKRWPDGTLAIQDFSAEFRPGEITALIGRNGSGKTTTLRLLAGLLEPDSGIITRPPGKLGFLFQQGALWPHLTVRQQLLLPLRLVNAASEPEADAERLMEEFNIKPFADRYPAELSGGQQQRVAIARCLCVNPKVVFLDEITNSLDPAALHEVAILVESLRHRGLIIVASTHDLVWVKNAANAVIYIKEGHLFRIGPPHEVMEDSTDEMFFQTRSS